MLQRSITSTLWTNAGKSNTIGLHNIEPNALQMGFYWLQLQVTIERLVYVKTSDHTVKMNGCKDLFPISYWVILTHFSEQKSTVLHIY